MILIIMNSGLFKFSDRFAQEDATLTQTEGKEEAGAHADDESRDL